MDPIMSNNKSSDDIFFITTPDTGETAAIEGRNEVPGLQQPEQLNHAQSQQSPDFQATQRSMSFWIIIVGLGVMMWLVALENTVLTTAAPIILEEIPLREHWIWLTNAFFLASAAFQPLLGQLADIFGRRWTALTVIGLFMIGSGICGGATNDATLIAGRAVQGAGSGGILMAYGK